MRKQSSSLHGAAAAASAAAAAAASSTGGTAAGGVGFGTTSRFRTKKLNPRQNLKILRAWELEEHTLLDISATVGDDSISGLKDSSLNTSLPRVESGVEHKEEKVSRCHVLSFVPIILGVLSYYSIQEVSILALLLRLKSIGIGDSG